MKPKPGLGNRVPERLRRARRGSVRIDALGQLPVSPRAFTNLQSTHHLGVDVKQTLEHRPEGLRLARLVRDVLEMCGWVA